MARQIDPWLGMPQTAVLEENLLAVQLHLQGLDVKLDELEARLGRVAKAASEAKADVNQVSGQILQLEAQLAGVAAALLMLADLLSGPGRSLGRPVLADAQPSKVTQASHKAYTSQEAQRSQKAQAT